MNVGVRAISLVSLCFGKLPMQDGRAKSDLTGRMSSGTTQTEVDSWTMTRCKKSKIGWRGSARQRRRPH